MNSNSVFRVAVLSVVKHDYIPKGIFSHARFQPVVVADDADQPDWVHERNQKLADEVDVPYVHDVNAAITEFAADVAVVSSAAERHCDLSVRAANAGLHVVQDKPMSTKLSECDRLVDAVARNNVQFLMWNRNFLPAIRQAASVVKSGQLGKLTAVHIDFYFAKDAGPPIGSRADSDDKLNWLEFLRIAHATGADGGVGIRPMGELEVEGIYPLAYLQLLTGARVSQAYARTCAHFHQLHEDNDVDDLSTITLQLEGGVVASICLGRIGNASHPDIGEIKLHLMGTEGSFVVSEARPEVGVYYRGQPDLEFPNRRVANDNDWLLADDFAKAIDAGTDTSLGVRNSREICATVHAAIESGRTGLPVQVRHRD
jgi:myo-inositol 2-dehydrogenase/D-chiro-inositol 1-dehydrogenase